VTIATVRSSWLALPARLVRLALIVLAALVAVEATYQWREFAGAYAVYGAIIALTVWRPRYGLYAVAFLAIALENQQRDPFMYWGFISQFTISTWSKISFLIFSPIELLVLVIVVVVLVRSLVNRPGVPAPQLKGPLLAFLGLVGISFLYGVATGGTLTVALWEVRSLVLVGILTLLVPKLLTRREHVDQLVTLLSIGVVLLSIDIIWRRFTLLSVLHSGELDSQFDHESPIFMNFVVVMLAARLVWPASTRQRLAALAIPLIIYAEMLTERRAGWIGLDVGMMLILMFAFRLRRKFFYIVGVPLILVYCGYLGAFWNAQGPIAQPARAIKSNFSPDSRDLASNLYRQLETTNVRLNIHAHPLTGLGFGRPYTFYIPMPDLSFWLFWHYEAHNMFLWLWMEIGPVGFLAFLTLIGAGIVRGVQVLKHSKNDRYAAIVVALVSGLVMITIYSYVDLGLTSVRIGTFFGIVLGTIGMWGRAESDQAESVSGRSV
jgi:hypothetical protein